MSKRNSRRRKKSTIKQKPSSVLVRNRDVNVLTRAERVFRVVGWLVLIVPPLVFFWYINKYGVNVPYWDEWHMVSLYRMWMNHSLTLKDLFAQHNQHRMFFPNLVYLIIWNISHGNTKSIMYVGAIMQVLSCAVILVFMLRVFNRESRALQLLLVAPIPFILFNLSQWENALSGFQMAWYMVNLFLCASLVLLEQLKPTSKYFLGLSIGCAVVATFSSMQGILVWTLGAIVLFVFRLKREGDVFYGKSLIIWSVSAVFALSAYFINWRNPDTTRSLVYIIHHPAQCVGYFFANLGGFYAFSKAGAIIGGIAMFTIYIYILRYIVAVDTGNRRNYFGVALILYSLLFDLMLVLGRSWLGIGEALSSRYTTVSILGLLGAYIWAAQKTVVKDRGHLAARNVLLFILFAIVIQMPSSWQSALIMGENLKTQRLEATTVLKNYEGESDKTIQDLLYPVAEYVRQNAIFLKHEHLNVFYRG